MLAEIDPAEKRLIIHNHHLFVIAEREFLQESTHGVGDDDANAVSLPITKELAGFLYFLTEGGVSQVTAAEHQVIADFCG